MCDGLTDNLCLKSARKSFGFFINTSAGQSANYGVNVDLNPVRLQLAGGCLRPQGESHSRQGIIVLVALACASLSAQIAPFTAQALLRECLCECVIEVALSSQTAKAAAGRKQGRIWRLMVQLSAIWRGLTSWTLYGKRKVDTITPWTTTNIRYQLLTWWGQYAALLTDNLVLRTSKTNRRKIHSILWSERKLLTLHTLTI